MTPPDPIPPSTNAATPDAGAATAASDPSASQTNWDVIRAARDGGPDARTAWDALVRRYWPAIHAYLRRFGHEPEDAADLTQGFMTDVILQRGLLDRADPARGRFRTLLLTSLRNYVRQVHRRHTRLKRGGGAPVRTLVDEPVADAGDPEAAFRREWRRSLLRATIERVRADCVRESLATHWEVFEARVARPLLGGGAPQPYDELVARLDLQDAAQAANMMITVKRRFARTIRQEIRRTIEAPAEVEDEIRELLSGDDGRPT